MLLYHHVKTPWYINIPALFLLVLFARGGRKSGESPGFDFKFFRKEFRPVSVEEREEGRGMKAAAREASSSGGEAEERREGVGKEGGGERREKN